MVRKGHIEYNNFNNFSYIYIYIARKLIMGELGDTLHHKMNNS